MAEYSNEFIDLVRDALIDEKLSMLNYLGASGWVNAELASEFIEHAADEFSHMLQITQWAYSKEVFNADDILAGERDTLGQDNLTDELLKNQMIKEELAAIERYKNICKYCQDNNFIDDFNFFSKLLEKEVEHYNDLLDIPTGSDDGHMKIDTTPIIKSPSSTTFGVMTGTASTTTFGNTGDSLAESVNDGVYYIQGFYESSIGKCVLLNQPTLCNANCSTCPEVLNRR